MSHLPDRLCLLGAAMLAFGPAHKASASPPTTETIVMLRHGEKPAAGLGQLDCQGLNRALALPEVIRKHFGVPAVIYAANPAEQKNDGSRLYDYVRPLATIEPAAIEFGLPVNTSLGLSDMEALRHELESPVMAHSLVVVAWEHKQIVDLTRQLVQDFGGDGSAVPDWPGKDFDSMYVMRIVRSGDRAQASFDRQQEGLNGQSEVCPRPPLH